MPIVDVLVCYRLFFAGTSMNKFNLLLSLIFVSLSSIAFSANKVIHLAYVDYPPYYGSQLEDKGPISEIIVEAFKRVNYTVVLHFVPSWARGLKDTREGKYDGLYSGWFREERKKSFVFSDPLPPNEVGFYKRKTDNIAFNNLEDLMPYSIGVVLGYANATVFELADLNTHAVEKENQNIGKLLLNRVDLVLIDKGVGRYILNSEYADQSDMVEWMSPAIEIAEQHLMLSRQIDQYQQKIDDFNLGLGLLHEQNIVEEIMKKHGIQ